MIVLRCFVTKKYLNPPTLANENYRYFFRCFVCAPPSDIKNSQISCTEIEFSLDEKRSKKAHPKAPMCLARECRIAMCCCWLSNKSSLVVDESSWLARREKNETFQHSIFGDVLYAKLVHCNSLGLSTSSITAYSMSFRDVNRWYSASSSTAISSSSPPLPCVASDLLLFVWWSILKIVECSLGRVWSSGFGWGVFSSFSYSLLLRAVKWRKKKIEFLQSAICARSHISRRFHFIYLL